MIYNALRHSWKAEGLRGNKSLFLLNVFFLGCVSDQERGALGSLPEGFAPNDAIVGLSRVDSHALAATKTLDFGYGRIEVQ